MWKSYSQTQDTQHAQVAREFALVAHPGQRLIGAGVDRLLAHFRSYRESG